MKILFERLRFDVDGSFPLPILPDGRMILLPQISHVARDPQFAKMQLDEQFTYLDLLSGILDNALNSYGWGREQLSLRREEITCDLNPDLLASSYSRQPGWRPNFRISTHYTTLVPGDLILFFASFQPTLLHEGKFFFNHREGGKKLVLAGYLEIGEIIPAAHRSPDQPEWLKYHGSNGVWETDWGEDWAGPGLIFFVATETLKNTGLPGAGMLRYRPEQQMSNFRTRFYELQNVSILNSFMVEASPELEKEMLNLIQAAKV